ncbi:hypothetical protein CERZMDRAFT_95571 [Cercospora zeae-maydis SCOH1-5]|uniref:Arb2 domain-containing protein n=1 Tax=Cercospora zeae-maydis SCOH1-5 TaxID=717836 RepID=A0A6A6FLG0_9PEZI|nr:hypothetical protein CERZMDRAFT_95571 [Cercospora zeae-maydis SCOH1-5]
MFRCTTTPSEPVFSTNLAAFGFHKNEKKEFVSDATGEHFDFFHTDSDRVNDLRRGAYQECLRKEIAAELKEKHGIAELFVAGANGAEISSSRPDGPNLSLLTTQVSELVHKRDIIIVIGESDQDCGVWAWRIVQRGGGMNGGSLTGLAGKVMEQVEASTGGGVACLTPDKDMQSNEQKAKAPGIIVLNPGQLLYSHDLGRCLTVASWQSRPRPTAISGPFKIEPKHNFIPGHENPHKHVKTVFQRILPQIISEKARLHVIAIGDGTTATIDAIDHSTLAQDRFLVGGGILESMALIEAKHEHEKVSQSLKTFLASTSRGWVQGEAVKGTVVQMPIPTSFGAPALECAPSAEARTDAHEETAADGDSTAKSPTVNGTSSANGDHGELLQPFATLSVYEETLSVPLAPPNTPADSGTTTPATVDSTCPSPAKLNKDDAIVEDEDEDYPAPQPLPVSCPTYSAGVSDGVTETVFPAVIDDVLEHLWFYIQKGQEKDAADAAHLDSRGEA